MSTYYLALTPVPMADLVGDRLKKHDIRENIVKGESNRKQKCLTDGTNFVWAYANRKGFVTDFTRYGGNSPYRIFDAICEEFGVRIVSEHEPEFFGYETYEEWEAAWAEEEKLSEEEFYNNVMNYVRGKRHSLGRGTVGMAKAQIAKKLIKESPELAADANRAELMKAVKAIYDRDQTITINVTEKDIAAALETPGTAAPWDFAG